ncbi:MAG TPA: hypothetical protein VGN16_06450 [Acidobacteriaceae bacterium]|jgi:hypothetical protein
MALEHEHHDAHDHYGPNELPSVLTAPDAVRVWRTRAIVVAAVFALISAIFIVTDPNGWSHLLRAWLMGSMTCFNFVGGALALLMVQYLSGGKWGLILRRPLEAMTRTWWAVAIMFVPVLIGMKALYQWAAYSTPDQTWTAYQHGLITQEQQLCINLKHLMLNPTAAWGQWAIVFGFMGGLIMLLNRWSKNREADPAAGSPGSFNRWRVLFENVTGPCLFLYVVLMTDFVIVFLKSLDVTWYSSVYGLQFLVAQGYAVLALGVLTLILLSKYEPIKTMFRTTEQHDIGKLMFAFVMLNIYLTFAEFLIIWSGNIPDEIPWYLNRIHGGWWTICSLDVICHWVIPFCILLSRDFKRSKSRMVWLCVFMIFARLVDMFWLTEPNFKDAAGNLHLAGNFSILAYITVPLALVAAWVAIYLTELTRRPVVVLNDPHTAEVLEPEHAH